MTNLIWKITIAIGFALIVGCTTGAGNQDQENADVTSEMTSDAPEASNATEQDGDFEEFEEEGDIAAADKEGAVEPIAEEGAKTPEEAAPPVEEATEVATEEPVEAPEESAAKDVVTNRVVGIQYLSAVSGGTIEIKTESPAAYSVRENPEKNQYIIEIQNAELASQLKRPFIMKDFDGAFAAINAYQNSGASTARIVVQLKTSGVPVVTQQGRTLLVMPPGQAGPETQMAKAESASEDGSGDSDSYDTKAASASEQVLAARTLDEFLTGSGKFFGRPISIQTNDADIRDVISFIAEESGVNLVISDDVEGKVTVKLRQVPWDQALVIIMRSQNLGYIRQGNVLRITKLATLQQEAQVAKSIVDSQKTLTALKVKVLPVSYASVTELVTQLKPFMTEGRGQIVSDTRTSSLVITDTADVLMKVERLVKELDIPPAQVMIEGKIVEATETFTRSIGVNWSLSGNPVVLSESGGVSGSQVRMTPSAGVSNVIQDAVRAQNGFMNLLVGRLDLIGDLNAALSLAQTDSLVKIISSPRIVTMNKEKSLISQKGEVISLKKTIDPVTRLETTEAIRTPIELKLEVTPQITAEGSVALDVNVLRQFAGTESDQQSKTRPVNSREAKTKVLVANGQTAVIGGIYQSDEGEVENGVPGLKDIPVVGWLFKQRVNEKVKNELLLFLTPRILNAKDQAVTE